CAAGPPPLGVGPAERRAPDLLGRVARPLARRVKRVISARLNHPSLVCPARAGLELSLVTAAVAAPPPRRPPFELHVSTGPSPQPHLGGPAATDPDLLLHFAVCRRAGVAVAGPGPVEVFAEPPRMGLLERGAGEAGRGGCVRGAAADGVAGGGRGRAPLGGPPRDLRLPRPDRLPGL